MPHAALLAMYCVVIGIASLFGGAIPNLIRLDHRRTQVIISGIAGFMLGVGLLQMLPHATEALGSAHRVVPWVLGGFLAMFFIERFSPFHHHDVRAPDPQPGHADHNPKGDGHTCEDCVGHSHDHPGPQAHGGRLTWSGAALGLTLHSLLDGVALSAAVYSSADAPDVMASLSIFLVICLHRPFDSLTLLTLMAADGWSSRARWLANGLFALAVPLGAVLFALGLGAFVESREIYVGMALGVASGTFLCIASSDLLPELQFHQHDRTRLSLALLAGVALARLVAGLDVHDGHAEHDHDHEEAGVENSAP